MKKGIVYIICAFTMMYQAACQRKMICPAYHSYFILDVDETRKTFSLFGEDSLPKKNWEVDKEKWGIAKEIPEQKKLNEMRIISMNSVYKKLEDPFAEFQHQLTGGDSSVYFDSAAAVARTNEYDDFQNVDQMIYLHHFGKYLPKKGANEEELMKEDMKEETESPVVGQDDEIEDLPKKKKKIWPFGKKKSKSDQLDEAEE